MKILPDKNFKENFKKKYEENYNKLYNKASDNIDKSAGYVRQAPELIKANLFGAAVGLVITGSLVITGLCMSTSLEKRQSKIDDLTYNLTVKDKAISMYQKATDADVPKQISEITKNVTALQTSYINNIFSDDFDKQSSNYLGKYNNAWYELNEDDNAADFKWQGFTTQSDYTDAAAFVFILYKNDRPVLVTVCKYKLDANYILQMDSLVKWVVL